jgi:sirohydrochlorin cobaltochelatase
MSEKLGVMVCGHGSRDERAVVEFQSVAQGLRERIPHLDTEWGFLEFATPIIRTGLDALLKKGVNRVLAVPGMLFAAGHAKNDIPSVLNRYQAEHEGVQIEYGRDLGIDLKLIRAAGERVEAALKTSKTDATKHETLLMVVGRGASDPDANSNISKVMRMLWEGLGFGWGEVCYSGVTFPLVEQGLEHAAKLGYKRIIVFPYFLFTGILVQRIYDHTNLVAARHPGIEFLKAGYLNDHPLVLDCFADRVQEILDGTNNMNCQLCKYREQFGERQESHHHHVEGIGTGPGGGSKSTPHDHEHKHDHEHGNEHDQGHSHDDGHSHPPYPHADHPLGPKSMTN